MLVAIIAARTMARAMTVAAMAPMALSSAAVLLRPVDMEGLNPSQKSHTVDQPYQPEIMIPMKVGYKDPMYPAAAYLITDNLYLSPFSTVNQVQVLLYRQYL